jgi:hypothetical protein
MITRTIRVLVLAFALAVLTHQTGIPVDTLTAALVAVLRVLPPGHGSRRGR